MIAFLVALWVVLLAVIAWLTHRLVVVPGWGRRTARVLVPLLLVALTALAFLQFGAGASMLTPAQARPLVWAGALWLSVAMYLVLGLAVLALVSLLLGWAGRVRGDDRARRRARRARLHRRVVPIVVTGALVVTAVGVWRAERATLTPIEVVSSDLSASFDGVRVAVVTDLHAGPVLSSRFVSRVVDEVQASQPDLVVFVGDVVDGPVDRYGPELAPLTGLPAPLGVFAVTGNHEMFTGTIAGWEQRWRDLGIRVLDNEATPVTRGADRIWVAGVHDVSGSGRFAPDYAAAVSAAAPQDFLLLLAHQPRAALQVDASRVDLQLSGRTHGGQLWPARYLVPLQQPMIAGSSTVQGVPVLTSRGAGTARAGGCHSRGIPAGRCRRAR